MTRVLSMTLAVLFAGCAFAAEIPGRLFYTPAQRAQLDAARAGPQQAQPDASEPAAPRPATQTITYSGIVRRSDGKSTLWLNNRPLDEKDALSNLSVSGRVRPDGAVTLQVPETGGTIDLRVGQRAELQTGRVVESRRENQDATAPKKDDPSKSDTSKSGADAKTDAPRPRGTAEQEPSEKKAERPPLPPQRELSPVEAQQRAAARARGETK